MKMALHSTQLIAIDQINSNLCDNIPTPQIKLIKGYIDAMKLNPLLVG